MTDLLVDLMSSKGINGCYYLPKLFLKKCWHRKLQICLIEMIGIPIILININMVMWFIQYSIIICYLKMELRGIL